MTRREWLKLSAAVMAASGKLMAQEKTAAKRRPRILLRSSWQTVNIGDIAHTPGVLRLLEEFVPQADVSLWPSNVGNGVEELLRRRFPLLPIVKSEAEVQAAFAECDFLLHGSGPSLVAQKDVDRWRRETAKPYGVYAVTLSSVNEVGRALIDGARFVYFRDSKSLQWAKAQNFKCPILEFAPDGAFGADVRNDAAAEAFLQAHDLQDGQFLCVIPRLRYTPYWKIHSKAMTAEDERKHARSEEMKEHDHAPLREAIVAVARQTPLKVLLCPEDQSQMQVGKEMLLDKLPADVKTRVVWRENYWLTDEALSIYRRSAGLFGLEMHSPIMCIGQGIPAIVCRFEEQTSKGFMWRDIGLGDWLFDMDKEDEIKNIVPTVLALAQDPIAAKAKAAKARELVRKRQAETMAEVAKHFTKI